MDELENRCRRSNLRLVGLPEKTEQWDMASFLQTWLMELLGRDVPPHFRTGSQAAGTERSRWPTMLNRHEIPKLPRQDEGDDCSSSERKGDVQQLQCDVLLGPVCRGGETTETIRPGETTTL